MNRSIAPTVLSIILFSAAIPFPAPPARCDGALYPIRFADRAREAGLYAFEHRMGHPDKRWIVDAMGSGVAACDYDRDGDPDLYFVNARPALDTPDPRWTNHLFRNEGGVFACVTEEAGVGDPGYGMCAVFGDVDNDGWPDLFVGNRGANALYRNRGDGTFEDATQRAGVGDEGYAAAAAFGDMDRDGDLDLFVGNYVEFDPAAHGGWRADYFGIEVFAGPLAFEGQRDLLYVNDGTGRFVERSHSAMINPSRARAMGAALFDMDGDLDLDLYTANDSTYNHLLKNRGDGVFEDLSFLSGGGFSDDGRGGASMGASAGDFDNDGLLDILVTAYELESDQLFRNLGDGFFAEESAPRGLFGPSLRLVTWGNGFCDFDADGLLDIYTVNGHVYPNAAQSGRKTPYRQGVSVYRNTGPRFEPVPGAAATIQAATFSARGSALLDFDGDGDMDIAVNCIDGRPLLLENRSDRGNWLKAVLNAPDAMVFGTRVTARRAGRLWTRHADGGSGYLSQNSAALHFGFGVEPRVDALDIHWPDGTVQTVEHPPLNQTLSIEPPSPRGNHTQP